MAWAMDSDSMEEAKTPKRWTIYLSPGTTSAFLARMTMEYPWMSQDQDSGQLSSSAPARLDFTGFQWKPALSFIRNQAKQQHSCSGRGRNPFTVCICTSFLCLFFTLTAEEEPGVPHTPHDPHWGNNPEQTCSKTSLPHVMEEDTPEPQTAAGGCCLSAMRKQSQPCRENPDSPFGREGTWKNQGIYPQRWDTLPWAKCWVPDTGNPVLANT